MLLSIGYHTFAPVSGAVWELVSAPGLGVRFIP